MKTLLGLFLIAHGLIHASYFTPKPNDPNYPFDFAKGWFAKVAGNPAKLIGSVLVGVVILSFLLGGLAILGVPGLAGLWQPFVTIGAISSTAVLLLFWHRWLILGVVINIILLCGIYWLQWNLDS